MTMDAVASRAGLGAEEVDDVRQRAGRQVVHTDSDDAETCWATLAQPLSEPSDRARIQFWRPQPAHFPRHPGLVSPHRRLACWFPLGISARPGDVSLENRGGPRLRPANSAKISFLDRICCFPQRIEQNF
jgi:hypothetical protein